MQGGATLSPGKQFLQWTVVERLGGGAFGDVYKILNSNGASFALKTESTAVETSVSFLFTNFCLMTSHTSKSYYKSHLFLIQVLTMDATVLMEASRRNLRHFCQCKDSGRYVSKFAL